MPSCEVSALPQGTTGRAGGTRQGRIQFPPLGIPGRGRRVVRNPLEGHDYRLRAPVGDLVPPVQPFSFTVGRVSPEALCEI